MAYREPRVSIDYARNFCAKTKREDQTFLPICERNDVRQSSIEKHFRLNTKVKALLANFGFKIWDDLYNVSAQQLQESRVLNEEGLFDLVKYAHHISLLKHNDLESDKKLERILNTSISNSDLIVYESNIESVSKFFRNPVYNWNEVEQLVFCRRFFTNDSPNRLAKDSGISAENIEILYSRLLREFQMLTFLGDLLDLLQKEKYRILSRWRLFDDVPELDIRPFKKFQNYRAFDVVIATMQFIEIDNSIVDLSKGVVANEILKELSGTLTQINGPVGASSSLNLIEPRCLIDYLDFLDFKKNDLYFVHSSMDQTNILINYLKLLGRPARKSEIRSDLIGFLDHKSMNQKIIDTHGVVIPITKEEYALKEWGYAQFLGAGEIISQYIIENGPTHIEMIYAILDGYGFSQKKIRAIASEPPFALIDEVCFVMSDDERK